MHIFSLDFFLFLSCTADRYRNLPEKHFTTGTGLMQYTIVLEVVAQ